MKLKPFQSYPFPKLCARQNRPSWEPFFEEQHSLGELVFLFFGEILQEHLVYFQKSRPPRVEGEKGEGRKKQKQNKTKQNKNKKEKYKNCII